MLHRRAVILLLVATAGAACKGAGADSKPTIAPPPPGTAASAPAAAAPPGDSAQDRPPLLQPGAPGQAARPVTPEKATDLSQVRHTQADVRFMQGMIGHHLQAIDMVALINTNSRNEDLKKLGLRIQVSQEDEINMMRDWLRLRGAEIPGAHAHHTGPMMPGMLSPDEMARLAAAKGVEFDRLFLSGMIKHHNGALLMVDELFATPGAAQDSDIYAFASDVIADQRMEMDRMAVMLKELQ
jgi:uncharacterized protein (DUF305 family)